MESTPPPQISESTNPSTSYQRGTTSSYASSVNYTREDYDPYLSADLENALSLTFDEFLQHVLHVPEAWVKKKEEFEGIIQSETYNKLRDNYCDPVGNERDRYKPYAELVNHPYLEEKSEPPFIFCRNDPIPIRSRGAERKPDVVGAAWGDAFVGERICPDNLSKNGPEGDGFYWTEVMTFMEHKMIQTSISVSDPSGPAKGSRAQSATGSMGLPAQASGSESRKARTRPPPPPATMQKRSQSAPSSNSPHLSLKRSRSDDVLTSSKRAKITPVEPNNPVTYYDLQCASYALEMLSRGGVRSHVIAGLVTDGKIELLYYDRSIIIKSEPHDFIDQPLEFLAMLKAMRQLTRAQWGYVDIIKPPSDRHKISLDEHRLLDNYTLRLEDGLVLGLLDTVYHEHGLIGRGTCVVRAEVEELGRLGAQWEGKTVVVKFSWPASSHASEEEFVKEARKQANEKDKAMLMHLPNMLHCQLVKDCAAEELYQSLSERFGDQYEKRVLRIIVQEELKPLTGLVKVPEVAKVFRDVFKCYRWLVNDVKILHRDISLNNIMYRTDEMGHVYGVLNDYDLAVKIGEHGPPSSKHQTGTSPFMAIDLLRTNTPCVHMFRHDLESLFYAILLFTSRWENGKESRLEAYSEWFILHNDELAREKVYLFITADFSDPTPAFKEFKKWIKALSKLFAMGQAARTLSVFHEDVNFDNSTLGGKVTFDTFGDALQMPIGE